jgi:hypothetical protein
MFLRTDLKWRPYLRAAAVGLAVGASTVTAYLASFAGNLDAYRGEWILLTAVLSGTVAGLMSATPKKTPATRSRLVARVLKRAGRSVTLP